MSSPDDEASSRRPRYRYVLIEARSQPGPSRPELVQLLQTRAPAGIGMWLTRYDGTYGIVRVSRDGIDEARRFLESGALSVRPILTSGSIAGLQRKHSGARRLRQTPR